MYAFVKQLTDDRKMENGMQKGTDYLNFVSLAEEKNINWPELFANSIFNPFPVLYVLSIP